MPNNKEAGPIERRLSEPPGAPAGPAPDGRPGRAPAAPTREVPGDSIAQRAATLLSSLPRPAELSPAALVRIRERLEVARAPAPRWPWTVAAAAASVAVAAVLVPRLTGWGLPAGEELTVRELRVPSSGVARLRSAPGSEWFLVGPGALALPAAAAPAQLSEGRLAVRAENKDVVLDAAGRRVTIPKGHQAEVVVHLGELVRVAAYSGDSSVRIGGRLLLVREGTAWTPGGARTLSAECRGLFLRALSGQPWPSEAACADGDSGGGRVAAQPVTATRAAEPELAGPRPPSEPSPLRPARQPVRPARPSAPLAVLVTPAASGSPAAAAEQVPAESGLAAESRLLGVALHQLRQERDGAAALRSLELYTQRFPGGLLAEEAQAARLDALLLLDHRSEALQLLDRTQFQRLGRGGELRVVRGELRAAAGRCREALTDFAAVLGTAPPPPLVAERALYGRASCLVSLGDPQDARAALGQYLAQFPAGRFADAARRSLQTLPAAP